jgi:hypothetical protein
MNQNFLQKLDEVNKASNPEESKVNLNHALLVALSTTVMLAKREKIDKEYYEWTRMYLENVRDEEGRKLPNIVGLLAKMDDFEAKNNIIEDEKEIDNIEGEKEEENVSPSAPEIVIDESDDEETSEIDGNKLLADLNEKVLSSTKNSLPTTPKRSENVAQSQQQEQEDSNLIQFSPTAQTSRNPSSIL